MLAVVVDFCCCNCSFPCAPDAYFALLLLLSPLGTAAAAFEMIFEKESSFAAMATPPSCSDWKTMDVFH